MHDDQRPFMQSVGGGTRIRRYVAPPSTNVTPENKLEHFIATPVSIRLAPVLAAAPISATTAAAGDIVPRDIEEQLLAIVEAAAPPGLTSSIAFRLKEEALVIVMSDLTIPQSRRMYMRLATPTDGDVLATAFAARLIGERRNRILQFLASAPRRAALRNAR